jgi:8-oxo-dGTP diphosphatase
MPTVRERPTLRSWLVGGALIEGPHGLLLVCNQRRNGQLDWTPPGGVIDADEELLAGLTREVREETGLVVTDWRGPRYEIVAEAPGLGWHLRVEAWSAESFSGDLHVADPDGIVVDARFVAVDHCRPQLEGGHPWVTEPLTDWLAERWSTTRRYQYRVDGSNVSSLVVTRV